MTNEDKVRVFMQKAAQNCPTIPTWPSNEVAELRVGLINEELFELESAIQRENLEDVADAICDLLYVVYGAGIAFGLPVQTLFDEVHRSNMSKFVDGHKNEYGKWIKGPSWVKPRIAAVLEECVREQNERAE